jgi:hypothetical protein
MKLLQEARGLSEITTRQPQSRAAAAPLQLRAIRWKATGPRAKKTIRIAIQDPPDIPHPVRIVHGAAARPTPP